jgi:hypothetical protein
MSRALLTVAGIVNALFGLFHILLGWQLRLATDLPPGARSLLQALNLGGALLIFFLAYASLFQKSDMLSTGLGRATQALAILVYWSRAAEEFVLFSFTPVIFFPCLIMGGIYVVVLLLGPRASSSGTAAS